jgi:hypothetical protein
MPNSKLQNNTYTLPDNLFNEIKSVKNGVLSSPTVNYSYLKKIKSKIDNGHGFTGNQDVDNRFLAFINASLAGQRDSVARTKEINMNLGMENQYKKTHTKDQNVDPQKPIEIKRVDEQYENKKNEYDIKVKSITNYVQEIIESEGYSESDKTLKISCLPMIDGYNCLFTMYNPNYSHDSSRLSLNIEYTKKDFYIKIIYIPHANSRDKDKTIIKLSGNNERVIVGKLYKYENDIRNLISNGQIDNIDEQEGNENLRRHYTTGSKEFKKDWKLHHNLATGRDETGGVFYSDPEDKLRNPKLSHHNLAYYEARDIFGVINKLITENGYHKTNFEHDSNEPKKLYFHVDCNYEDNEQTKLHLGIGVYLVQNKGFTINLGLCREDGECPLILKGKNADEIIGKIKKYHKDIVEILYKFKEGDWRVQDDMLKESVMVITEKQWQYLTDYIYKKQNPNASSSSPRTKR